MTGFEHPASGAARWPLLLALALTCAACRKLPGPDECQRVAAALLGITDAMVLGDARIKQRFDQLTTECLLTPYDGELVRCLDETRRARQCLLQFQRRLEDAHEQDRALPENGAGTSVRRW